MRESYVVPLLEEVRTGHTLIEEGSLKTPLIKERSWRGTLLKKGNLTREGSLGVNLLDIGLPLETPLI